MSTVTLKRNDTNLKFNDTILVNGVAADLSDASVSFILRSQPSGLAVKRSATVANAATGQVEYSPVLADVSIAGDFDQEWEVVWLSGKQLSIPTRGFNRVTILEDLA
jgi:hypothetical protein